MPLTSTEKAVKAARTRNKTAALRSLKLIIEAAAQHLSLLEQGAVPESNFMASALKYDQSLTAMRTADTAIKAGDAPAAGDDGLIEVRAEDVALLAQVVRAVVPAQMLGDGGPLVNLEAAVAGTQPAAPETGGEPS
jgi:hypothetical protein